MYKLTLCLENANAARRPDLAKKQRIVRNPFHQIRFWSDYPWEIFRSDDQNMSKLALCFENANVARRPDLAGEKKRGWEIRSVKLCISRGDTENDDCTMASLESTHMLR